VNAMKNMDVRALTSDLTEKVLILKDEFRRKGVAYFKIPLLVLVLGVYSMYSNVYSSAVNAQHKVRAELTSVRAQADVASVYRPAKMQEVLAARRLPKPSDKDWLNKTLQKIFDEEGVVPRSMGTPAEADMGDYLLVTMSVSLTPMTFATFVKILTKVENSPTLIKINTCDLMREPGNLPGQPLVSVNMAVSTVVPKEGLPNV